LDRSSVQFNAPFPLSAAGAVGDADVVVGPAEAAADAEDVAAAAGDGLETTDTAEAESSAEAEPGEEAAVETADAAEPDAGDASMHGHGDAGTAPIASVIAGAAVAQSVDSPAVDATGVDYGVGREALPEEIAAWNIDVRPDGTGLPEGSGDVWTGEEVFIEQCAVCHGDFAEGRDRWPVLAGGMGSLTRDRPVKTVGSYWPYLSTVWDYVNRAMPFGYAQSLTPDEVYAITAYLLYSNGIVEDDFTLSRENFTEVEMPNEDGFFMDDREETEMPAFTRDVCMEDCKESVEITMRAAVLDVTPETEETTDGADAAPAEPAQDDAAASSEETPAEEEMAAAPDAAGGEDAASETAEAEAPAAPAPELVAAGEAAFRQCSTCHQVGEDAENRVGPHLNGVIGRTAGTVEGFRYSNAMADAGEEGLVWTAETLDAFLSDPRNYIKGTKMSFRGYRDESDVAAVTAYLRTFGE
jgi:cytochrome c